MNPSRVSVIGLFTLCACILFANLGGWDLWNPDEPRYAQVAREMMDSGVWLPPQINGRVYADKPPLFFWMIALASQPFGDVTASAARFPAAFFGLGLVMVTFLFAWKLRDRLTGFLAAAIVFTTEGFFTAATSVHLDTMLAFFTTAALLCFWCGYAARRRGPWYLLTWVCIGLAVSTKGPVGLAVPLITIIGFLLATGDFGELKRLRPGTGAVIVGVLVAVWLVPCCISGGDEYTRDILFRQSFGRVVNAFNHQKPCWYYAYKFPFHFLPWSLFLPGAGCYFWNRRRQMGSIRFPLIWFGASFLFFSLISCKRGLYLVPLYPAMSILVATFWRDQIRTEEEHLTPMRGIGMRVPAGLVSTVCMLAGAGTALALALDLGPATVLPFATVPVIIAAGLLCLLGLYGCVCALCGIGVRAVFTVTALQMLFLGVVMTVAVYPACNRAKSAKPFAARISAVVQPDDPLVAAFKPELFNYYLNRYPIPYLRDARALRETLAAPGKKYLLITQKQFAGLAATVRETLTIVDTARIGHRVYCLAVSRAGASALQ